MIENLWKKAKQTFEEGAIGNLQFKVNNSKEFWRCLKNARPKMGHAVWRT